MKSLLCLVTVLCGMFGASLTKAAPPLIDYQGFLRDTQTGQPLEGQQDLVFRLYGSITGPDSLWAERHDGVNLDQGVFSVRLGDFQQFPLPMFQQPALFLEVSVAGQAMSPRTQLVSVPYALFAQVAQQAVRADSAGFAADASHAAEADTAAYAEVAGEGGSGDSYWAEDGNDIHSTNPGDVYVANNFHLGGNLLGLPGIQGLGNVSTGWYSDTYNLRAIWPAQDGSFGAEGPGHEYFTVDARGFHVRDGFHWSGIANWYPGATFNIAANGASPDAAQVYWGDGSGWKTHFGYRAANGDFLSRFTFVDAGRLGIGTTNPGKECEVRGNIAVLSYTGASAASLTATSDGGAVWSNDSYDPNNSSQGWAPAIWWKGGSVGVGTSNPLARLHVNGAIFLPGSAWNQMTRPPVASERVVGEIAGGNPSEVATDDGFLRLSAGGGTSAQAKTFIDLTGYSTVPDMYQNISLGTSGLERVRISSNGNVGIGTANPAATLHVAGDLCVTGQKNAIVPTSQGMTKVYSEESTEVWFTDYGRANLKDGFCRVELPSLFLETVSVTADSPMMVFLQEEAESNGLVVHPDLTGFDVTEKRHGTSDAVFNYRVVAKRRGYENRRLEPAGGDR